MNAEKVMIDATCSNERKVPPHLLHNQPQGLTKRIHSNHYHPYNTRWRISLSNSTWGATKYRGAVPVNLSFLRSLALSSDPLACFEFMPNLSCGSFMTDICAQGPYRMYSPRQFFIEWANCRTFQIEPFYKMLPLSQLLTAL